MLRLGFILTCLLVSVANFAAAETPRPNILFINTDDQPYKTVGCYPEAPQWVKTPNLDRLAETGVRFERSYLGAWCMPSRACLLTGRLPHAIESLKMEGTYPGATYDPQVCRYWPSVFREHGYQTAQIGKWHTGIDDGFGRDWDFQRVWNRPRHPDNAGAYFYGQVMEFNGIERSVEGYSTDNYTDWAVEYIRGEHREQEKPWYLWLCYGAVHGPTTPAERHIGAYAGHAAPIPAIAYQVEYSTDGGGSWAPIVRDWRIVRQGDEPQDFWSQSFCYGDAALPDDTTGPVRVRFHNSGGKRYLRAEVHLGCREPVRDNCRVTFAWSDDRQAHRTATHEFSSNAPDAWTVPTGKNVMMHWVEYRPAP